MFKLSKIEWNKFKYLDCKVEKLRNGDISLNQNSYKIQDPIQWNKISPNLATKKTWKWWFTLMQVLTTRTTKSDPLKEGFCCLEIKRAVNAFSVVRHRDEGSGVRIGWGCSLWQNVEGDFGWRSWFETPKVGVCFSCYRQ